MKGRTGREGTVGEGFEGRKGVQNSSGRGGVAIRRCRRVSELIESTACV